MTNTRVRGQKHTAGLYFLSLLLASGGCGASQARHAAAVQRSSNQMKEMILGMNVYRDANDGAWPEQLFEIRPYTDNDLDLLLENPITGDHPGYEYIKPIDGAPLESTVVLYQLRNGERDTDLRVGYADNRVAELVPPASGN